MREKLEKLCDIAKSIYELYEQLALEEEVNGNNTNEYKKIIENITLFKYLEDRYYKELDSCEIIYLNDLARMLNTDDVVEADASNFEFSLDNIGKDSIIGRRIFTRLVDIMILKEDNDYYLNFINDEIFELDRGAFALNNKMVSIADRAFRICEMTWNIHDNLSLEYIYEVQKKIDSNHYKKKYLKNKYINIYINNNIENVMIKNNFKIHGDLNIKYNFQDALDASIYNEILDMNVLTEINQLLDDIPYIDDMFIANAAKTYIESISPRLDNVIKNELIFGLKNSDTTKKYAKLLK